MARGSERRRAARGMTLLEAVISLSILLVGILGTFQLQIFSMTSDEGSRAYTGAVQAAQELLAALQQLPASDPLLEAQSTGLDPPPEFGHLRLSSGILTSSSFATYSDSAGIEGVTPDSEFIARSATDPLDASQPRFRRRWTVWMPSAPAGLGGSKLIAVSVTWRERAFTGLQEVVVYGSVVDPSGVTAPIGGT